VPDQPVGVPPTFKEYVELLFDLEVIAFQDDITRVASFMMARENIQRGYPEIGLPAAHHSMSHHGNNPQRMKDFAKLNTYHVEMLAYFLKKLDSVADGDGSLLDQTIVLYGSGMSDGNVHNTFSLPVVLAGGGALHLKGNRHVRFAKGTPLANLMLGVMDRYGVNADKFGDSTSEIDLLTL
jgi:hypothetical protein